MKTLKRILALAGVVIIVGLYVTTLVIALVGGENSGKFLIASIVATVVIPTLLYIFNWLYNMIKEDTQERSDSQGAYIKDQAGYENDGSGEKEESTPQKDSDENEPGN